VAGAINDGALIRRVCQPLLADKSRPRDWAGDNFPDVVNLSNATVADYRVQSLNDPLHITNHEPEYRRHNRQWLIVECIANH
jgi:hypothetical protein